MIRCKFNLRILFIFLLLLLWSTSAKLLAQGTDSLQLKVGTISTFASQQYQPKWLVSNRWGAISDQQYDVSTYVYFSNKHIFGSKDPFKNYLRTQNKSAAFAVSYGLRLYNNELFTNTFFQEAYVKAHLNNWELAVGRFREVVGEVNPQTSSGSMGISGNALPIPKISLSVIRYTDVPLLPAGAIQFKGGISHGLLGSDAFVKDANYHQRSFYLQLGKRMFKTFTMYGGVNQFVVWGGEHPERGSLPGQYSDLTKPIVPGNNLGFFDYGASLRTPSLKITAYTQVPFEGRGNFNPLRIKDRLVGVLLSDPRPNSYFPEITFELINTTWQDPDPENLTSKEDYNFYNNTVYADGWTYQGRILGTPLFFTRQSAIHYFGEEYNINPNFDWNIVNNRLNGVHIGINGQVPLEEIYYKTLITISANYGNYYVSNLFRERSNLQSYFMQEVNWRLNSLKLKGALALDIGGITKNYGIMMGIEYDLIRTDDFRKMNYTQYQKRRKRNLKRW